MERACFLEGRFWVILYMSPLGKEIGLTEGERVSTMLHVLYPLEGVS